MNDPNQVGDSETILGHLLKGRRHNIILATKVHASIEPDILDQSLEREMVLWENNPDVDVNALMDTQQIQLELGFQEQIYDVESILDLRFIPETGQ